MLKKLLISIVLSVRYIELCQASPWLIKPKQIKLGCEFGTLDERSLTAAGNELAKKKHVKQTLHSINKEIRQIHSHRSIFGASNYHKSKLAQLTTKRNKLQQQYASMPAYNSANWYKLNAEYGLSSDYNLIIQYFSRKETTALFWGKSKEFHSKIDLKFKLKESNISACSLATSIEFNGGDNFNYTPSLELNYGAVTYTKKKRKFINSFGYSCGINRNVNNWQPIFKFTTKQEIQLQQGVFWGVFNAFYLKPYNHKLTGNRYSESFLCFELGQWQHTKLSGLNLKLGYFQAQELTHPHCKLSGPTLAIWYII